MGQGAGSRVEARRFQAMGQQLVQPPASGLVPSLNIILSFAASTRLRDFAVSVCAFRTCLVWFFFWRLCRDLFGRNCVTHGRRNEEGQRAVCDRRRLKRAGGEDARDARR
jgi:hypothetical protein